MSLKEKLDLKIVELMDKKLQIEMMEIYNEANQHLQTNKKK